MTTEDPIEQPLSAEMAEAYFSKQYCENPAFRAEFDADPRRALEQAIGAPMPEEATVVVHRRQPDEIHVALPDADMLAAQQAEQLSDAMLEQVSAAGAGWRDKTPADIDWANITQENIRYALTLNVFHRP